MCLSLSCFMNTNLGCRAFASLSDAIGRSVLITVANYSLPPASITCCAVRNGAQRLSIGHTYPDERAVHVIRN